MKRELWLRFNGTQEYLEKEQKNIIYFGRV